MQRPTRKGVDMDSTTIKNGALAAKTARGNLRGARIPVTEMDRYMEVHGNE